MPIKVWDLPLRLFHWLLVICVSGALITIQLGNNWMQWHERFGLAVLGLLAFRLAWGLVGSTYSRFSSFFPTPKRLISYLQGQWQQPGHNPLGAFSVFAMLGLFAFQALSGLVATDDIAFSGPLARQVSSEFSSLLSGWHRWTEELIYALLALHLLAILIYRLRGKHLVGPMLHGRQQQPTGTRETRGGGWIALILAIGFAALVVWGASGSWIPAPPPAPAVPAW